jgi:hypothetical protein
LKPGERPFLHCQICLDVLVRRSWTLVAEPKPNDAYIDAGLQQVHRRRVANHMRRYLACRQIGAGFHGKPDSAIEPLYHVPSRHRLAIAIGQQWRVRTKLRISPKPGADRPDG